MTVNTRVLVNDFEYTSPSSLDEALGFLDRHGEDAKVLAGGTDLIIQMKLGRRAPKFLVDISKLEELKHLEAGEKIRIGAGRRYMDVLPFLRGLGRYHSLAEAIDSIGKLQVLSVGDRRRQPRQRFARRGHAAAAHHLRRARPREERRTWSASSRCASSTPGRGATVLAPDEIIVDVEFDAFPEGRASAFRKLTRVA